MGFLPFPAFHLCPSASICGFKTNKTGKPTIGRIFIRLHWHPFAVGIPDRETGDASVSENESTPLHPQGFLTRLLHPSSHGMDLLLKIRWRPVIGDPSPMGWFTVAAYALAAFLAWRAWSTNRDRVWLGVTVLMALLCLNKQFDLQSLFTDLGREFARLFGQYEHRRGFQKFFIVAVLGIVAVFGPLFAWKYRAFLASHKLLAAGLVFLLTFIVVRAISFHHMDVFLKKSRMGGVKMNWILELTGIGLVALAAWRERFKTKLKT
jgi:hypothetical protein